MASSTSSFPKAHPEDHRRVLTANDPKEGNFRVLMIFAVRARGPTTSLLLLLYQRPRGRTPLALWPIWAWRRGGACSLGSDSARPPIVFTSGLYLRSTSSITGPHTGFVETMHVRSVPATRLVAGIVYHPMQVRQPPVSAQA